MARTKASLRGHPGKLIAERQLSHAESGMAALKQALWHFRQSDNQRTLKRVRYAISSAYGAQRICQHRCIRLDAEATIKHDEERKNFQWAPNEK